MGLFGKKKAETTATETPKVKEVKGLVIDSNIETVITANDTMASPMLTDKVLS